MKIVLNCFSNISFLSTGISFRAETDQIYIKLSFFRGIVFIVLNIRSIMCYNRSSRWY